MKRNNKDKILSIIALVIALSGLTIGFAAFSSTLTISSSATVTPTDDEFIIKIYGTESQADVGNDLSKFTSEIKSVPFYNTKMVPTDAIIDNDNLKITNLNVTFEEPQTGSAWAFVIKNKGKYDAYLKETINYISTTKECTPSKDATPELVTEACKGIVATTTILDSSYNPICTNGECASGYKIPKEDLIVLIVNIEYQENAALADGDFSVKFADYEFEFSTAPIK